MLDVGEGKRDEDWQFSALNVLVLIYPILEMTTHRMRFLGFSGVFLFCFCFCLFTLKI